MLPRHDEQLAHHAAALANVLLHQLGTGHADELAVGVVGHGAGQERLPCARRAIEQYTLGLRNTERLEQLGVFESELDDLLDFLDLLVQATNHVVGAVGYLLDHHEGDERVDGGWEHLLELIRVG